jgi:hypothetical protein
VNLGLESRKKTLWAAGLGVVSVVALGYVLIPVISNPSTTPLANSTPSAESGSRPAERGGPVAAKKVRADNLDPTLRLELLAASEQTQYSGSGRNIFVSQAEVAIPTPVSNGTSAGKEKTDPIYQVPQPPAPGPIPLKFFGFANRPGAPKRVFLSQGEDIFIAGEGEVVDRRYKVVRISPTSVEIQDVVGSGPPQTVPLTQG